MIIDTADNCSKKLAALKTAGVDTIIRYDCRFASGDWKQLHEAEAKLIADAGMKLGIVYEDRGATASSFSQTNGFLAATYSRKMAPGRGQPDNSAVYFAVDFDVTASQMRSVIIPYFKGVYQAFGAESDLPKLRVGAYCSGLCAEMLKAIHPDILIWITCSGGFSGSRAYVAAGKHDLHQTQCDKTLSGLSVDYNDANKPDWGSFVPGGNPPPPPPPLPITHDLAWLQKILSNKNYGYTGKLDNDPGPKTIAAMIRYAEWHELS